MKHGISTGAGVIDADYRGEVKVVLFNHSEKISKLKKVIELLNWYWNKSSMLISKKFHLKN